jgi:hypothetical protein
MYLPLALRTVYRIVQERVSGCKQLLRSSGMRTMPYWCSWWCGFTLINIAIAIACGALSHFKIFHATSLSVLVTSFLLIGQAYFGLVWISASLFDNPQTSCALLACMVWVMTVTELSFEKPLSATPSSRLVTTLCLLNPMLTIKQLMRVIVTFDNAGLTVNFSNGLT